MPVEPSEPSLWPSIVIAEAKCKRFRLPSTSTRSNLLHKKVRCFVPYDSSLASQTVRPLCTASRFATISQAEMSLGSDRPGNFAIHNCSFSSRTPALGRGPPSEDLRPKPNLHKHRFCGSWALLLFAPRLEQLDIRKFSAKLVVRSEFD